MSQEATPKGGGAADAEGYEDEALEDEDLWASDAPPPLNRTVIIAVAVAVVLVIIGFVVLGGDDSGNEGPTASGGGTSAAADGGTTQITSQQAPFGAKVLTPTTLPPGAVPRGCGTWDTAFNNPPKEVVDGVYVWSDFDGWHVRLAGPTLSSVSGTVRGQYLPALQSPATAAGVTVTPDAAGKRLVFELEAGEQPVGFDFSAGCDQKELTFDLVAAGAAVPLERIHLGSKGVVEEVPIVARRTLPPAG